MNYRGYFILQVMTRKLKKLTKKMVKRQNSKEGRELQVSIEITSENMEIVDETVFKEMWGKCVIGKTLDR